MKYVTRCQPPVVDYAVGATSPTGRPGEVVWSTVANGYLQWHAPAWMRLARLAVPADGTPPAIGAAGSTGADVVAAPLNHSHAHGNQLGGALHALATASADGFLSAAQWSVIQSLGVGTDTSAGLVDAGKIPKLGVTGYLDPDFIPFATDTDPGIIAAEEHKAWNDLRLPPWGKITRAWVPNSNVTTSDDRGWGSTTWGTLGNVPIANASATRFARIRFTTGTTLNAGAGVTGALNVQRCALASPLIGGFRFSARFRLQALAATNQWMFVGLGQAATWTGATLPTAIPNCIGLYARAGVLSMLTVSSGGVNTPQTPPNISYSSLTSGVEMYIESLEGDTTVLYWGTKSLDGTWFHGQINTNLPALGVPLGPVAAVSVSSTLTPAASVEMGPMTLQTRY